MAIRLNKSQKIGGVDYPNGIAIIGLDKVVEDLASQGGAATPVNLFVTESPVSGAGIGRGLRTVILGDSFGAYNNAGVAVSTIVLSAGVITVVASSAHQMRDGQRCNVSGTTNSTFHIRNTPITYISSTSFSYVAPAGASGTATGGAVLCQNQLNSCGDWVHTNARLGGRMRFVSNLGVGGQTSAEILARVQEAWDLLPDLLWLNALTNDVIQDVAFASSTANVESIVQGAVTRNVFVVIKTLPPFASGGPYYTAARNANLLNINQWIRRLATRYRNVFVIDAYRSLINPTDANGYGKSTHYQSGDSVHYGPRGAFAIANDNYQALSYLIPPIDNRVTSITDNYGFNSANRDLHDRAPWTNSGGSINAPAVVPAAWASTTAYALSAAVITGGRIYYATVAGTSSGVAPTHTSGTAVDGTVTWQFVASGAFAGPPTGFIIDASGAWTVPPIIYCIARADGLGYNITAYGVPGAAGNSVTIRTDSTLQNSRLPSFVGKKYRWVSESTITNAVSAGVRSLEAYAAAAIGTPSGQIAAAFAGLSQAGLLSFNTDAATTLSFSTPEFEIPSGAVSNNSYTTKATVDAASSTPLILTVGSVRMQPMDDV